MSALGQVLAEPSAEAAGMSGVVKAAGSSCHIPPSSIQCFVTLLVGCIAFST